LALALDPTNKPIIEEANKLKETMNKTSKASTTAPTTSKLSASSASSAKEKKTTETFLKDKVVERDEQKVKGAAGKEKIVEIVEPEKATESSKPSEKIDPFKVISEATAKFAKPEKKEKKKETPLPPAELKEMVFQDKLPQQKKPEDVFYGGVKEKAGSLPSTGFEHSAGDTTSIQEPALTSTATLSTNSVTTSKQTTIYFFFSTFTVDDVLP
jgi:hypothetical protein